MVKTSFDSVHTHLYLTGRVLYTVTDLYETMYYRHSGDILFVL